MKILRSFQLLYGLDTLLDLRPIIGSFNKQWNIQKNV